MKGPLSFTLYVDDICAPKACFDAGDTILYACAPPVE